MYVCMYVYVCIYVCMYVCMYACVCVRARARTLLSFTQNKISDTLQTPSATSKP